MNCEGVTACANSLLKACPLSKNIHQDKFCLGFFQGSVFIAFLDIIQHFPSDHILTIGYFLIHPSYQSQGIGSQLTDCLSTYARLYGFHKLRLVVQSQNPKALDFWQQSQFTIVHTLQEKLGKKKNINYVLERLLIP